VTYKRNPGQERARRELFTAGFRFNLIFGGSRSGKTFETVGTIIERALFSPNSRHLIVRQEGTAAKRALVKGTVPEVIALRWPGLAIKWNELYGYYELPNGSQIWIGGLNDDKALEKILGNEYASIYINEASEVRYSAFTLLRSRLAQVVDTIDGDRLSQRFYVDLNPTTQAHWTHKLWIQGKDPETDLPIDDTQYGHIVVNPMDNEANLSPEYLKDLQSLPPHARKRFWDGQYQSDAPDAIWRREIIRYGTPPADLARVVVAIDPATTADAGSDETGIVCAAADAGRNGWTLADDSGRYKPMEWARRAIGLYDQFDADCIVAEANQGGEMVVQTIRSIRPTIPIKTVNATRGKIVRAEPVASLYEQGKIFHAEPFPALEDQMCAWTVGLDRKKSGFSPDRVDALVWAFTDLFGLVIRKQALPKAAPQPVSMPFARAR
jgi:hypothetical protein